MKQGWLRRTAETAAVIAVCAVWLGSGPAQATEGYFQYGYGARQGALGGAGVADSRDAMALSLNPAGLVDVGRQWQFGASLFMPFRSYTATAQSFPPFPFSFVAPGSFDSNQNYFIVPNIAYNNPIDLDSSWGVTMYGNGGMNTNWGSMSNATGGCQFYNGPAPFVPGPAGVGAFCAGNSGVDLMQAFIAVGYARRFGTVSVGISPVVAIQRFKAWGISPFKAVSADPAHMTDNGYDWSYGGGVRAGLQWNVTNAFRIGVSGSTPMWMTKFDKYAGLFAQQGSFDIPANITVGIAVDVMPTFTVMVDYKHIFYGSVDSVANPSFMPGAAPGGTPSCVAAYCFGADQGAGFGWHDIDIFKIGAEWRASPMWTYRIGYAHNTNPIQAQDVTLNILAPGVVTDHITGGFAYKPDANQTFEFAAAYVPSHSVTGNEILPVNFGGNTGDTVTISMHQLQFSFGYTYEFAEAPAPRMIRH